MSGGRRKRCEALTAPDVPIKSENRLVVARGGVALLVVDLA
jgi:hypothetical protein